MPKGNEILNDAKSSANKNIRGDLRSGEEQLNPWKNKAIIYNTGGQLDYNDIKTKIDQGYTPISLSSFKHQTNQYFSSLPNGMGSTLKNKLRLNKAGITSFNKYEEAIKTGNPGRLGSFDDRNLMEKMLNTNPNQGFLGDVFEILNRPLQGIKNSIYSIGEGQDIGQRTANFVVGFEKGLSGNADEHTWGQAMSNATGAKFQLHPLVELAMDIFADPLNIVPLASNKIRKISNAPLAREIATDKKSFDKIHEDAIKGQDILDEDHITPDDYNKTIKEVGKEATKTGASKEFVKQFQSDFIFEASVPKSARNLKDNLIGDADELSFSANPLLKELEDATSEEHGNALKFIETRGKEDHEWPVNLFHQRIYSLKTFKKTQDSLHFFGKEIMPEFKQSISKTAAIKNTIKKSMVDLIKENDELNAASGLNRTNLTPEVRSKLTAQRKENISKMKSYKERLSKVNKTLDLVARTQLGPDIFKTIDKINSLSRSAKISKRGQNILHVDISGDLAGFKLYTSNSEGLKQILEESKVPLNKLHGDEGIIKVPIEDKHFIKWDELSEKEKMIVKKYDFVKAHKTAFVKKYSKYYENRFDWERYAQHSLTDEAKLLVSGGGENDTLLGNPGEHAEQANVPSFAEVSKMNENERDAASQKLGYKDYKDFNKKRQTEINKSLTKMYNDAEKDGTIKEKLSSRPRRIMGTIGESNDRFGMVDKFFKDDLSELVHLDMTNIKRYVLPESFLTSMANQKNVRFLDSKGNINEISISLDRKGNKKFKIETSNRGLGHNEKVFSIGPENGGLGFSSDVAGHLAKSFKHDKVVMEDNAAFMIQRMNKVGKSNQLNLISNAFMSTWKGSKLMTPGFHARKFTGEMMATYLSGLSPLKVMNHMGQYKTVKQSYEKVVELLSEGNEIEDINPRLLNHYEEFKQFIKDGVVGDKGSQAQFKDVVSLSDAASKKGGFFAKAMNKAIKFNYNLVGKVDTAARFGVWREAILNPKITRRFVGREDATAADMVKAVKFDYNNSTKTEDMIKKVIPFWTFAKNNTMLAAKSFIKNPNRINHIANLINNSLQNTGLDSTQLPDYVKNQGYLSLEGMRDMITGKTGSSGAGDDSFLKWGSIVNDALNPLDSLSAVSPLISAGKTALGGEGNKYATNWDQVSQQYNYMRAVSGDMGINPQQAESQMSSFDNPFAKLGIAAPRTFSVMQELDPTPIQGWIKTLNGIGQDVDSGTVGAHTFFPSVVKHIDPIEMKMTQLYFEKGMISQLKSAYQTVTGTYLPSLTGNANPKQVVDKTDVWKDFYSGILTGDEDHRTQADWNDILQESQQ